MSDHYKLVLLTTVGRFEVVDEQFTVGPGTEAEAAERVRRAFFCGAPIVVDDPVSFYVEDVRGPLVAGERERARRWAHRLVTIVKTHPARRSA